MTVAQAASHIVGSVFVNMCRSSSSSSSSASSSFSRQVAAGSVKVPRLKGEKFLFSYTGSLAVVEEADFKPVTEDLGAAPEQLPFFVWRDTGDPSVGLFGRILWVVIDKSLAGSGLGVYAAFPFKAWTAIGVYVGEVIGDTSDNRQQQNVEALPHDAAHDALIVIDGQVVSGKHPPWHGHTTNHPVMIPDGKGGSRALFPLKDVSWPGSTPTS
jgi:hypothetical protein